MKEGKKEKTRRNKDVDYNKIEKFINAFIINEYPKKVGEMKDITQEVLIKVFKHKPEFWKPFCIATILTTIVDLHSKHLRSSIAESEYLRITSYPVSIRDPKFTNIIDTCSPILRDKYLKSMSIKDISKRDKISVGNVKMRLRRERLKAKKRLT